MELDETVSGLGGDVKFLRTKLSAESFVRKNLTSPPKPETVSSNSKKYPFVGSNRLSLVSFESV